MDESLISGKSPARKNSNLKIAVSVYLVYIVILGTFILSCVGLGLTSASVIQNKMYTYSFPYMERWTGFGKVTPVSIDRRGNIWPGAGTTIYRNITRTAMNMEVKNVKVQSLSYDLMLIVYDGGCRVVLNSYETNQATPYPSRDFGNVDVGKKPVVVRSLKKINNNMFVLVTPLSLVPIDVSVERRDDGRVSVQLNPSFDGLMPLPKNCIYPYVDVLSDYTLAMTCENGYFVMAYHLTWSKTSGGVTTITNDSEKLIGYAHQFHGVSGMTEEYFIATAAGVEQNSTGRFPYMNSVLMRQRNKQLEIVNDWVPLPWVAATNWVRVDNFNNHTALVVYGNAINRGLNAVLIHLSFHDDGTPFIHYGASMTLQSGGAIFNESSMEMCIFDASTFGVMYEDSAHFGVKLRMGAITSVNDLVSNGPAMTISQSFGRRADFSFSLCEFGWYGNFAIVESGNFEGRRQLVVHRGDVRNRPFGIAVGTTRKTVKIQFHGTIRAPGSNFTPGRGYYTNSRANIIGGPTYGYANNEWGVGAVYVHRGTMDMILLTRNILGVAVTKEKIKLMIDKA